VNTYLSEEPTVNILNNNFVSKSKFLSSTFQTSTSFWIIESKFPTTLQKEQL
jgi:hypothetical protein